MKLGQLDRRFGKISRSFVLLEVIVSMVILAVSMSAILRGFAIALSTVRENRVIEVSSQLAQTLLDDLELVNPADGKKEGSFEEDERFGEDFSEYSYEWDVEEEDVDYDDVPTGFGPDDFETMFVVELKIIYDNGRHRSFVPININTAILREQIFSPQATQANQLF